jgi:hypothetical protein
LTDAIVIVLIGVPVARADEDDLAAALVEVGAAALLLAAAALPASTRNATTIPANEQAILRCFLSTFTDFSPSRGVG